MAKSPFVVEFDELKQELRIDGLRFSYDVLATIAPASEGWAGPFWIRRQRDVVEYTTIAPASQEELPHV